MRVQSKSSANTELLTHALGLFLPARLRTRVLLLVSVITVVTAGAFAKPSPGNFELIWAKQWCDNHFLPYPGKASGYGITVDNAGYIYFAGQTRGGPDDLYHAFITKTDQDLNEIWYRRDYAPAWNAPIGISRIAIAADGNLIAHTAARISDQSYVRVLKVDSCDGSVIWQTDIPKICIWAWIWGDMAGPALDRLGNIYVAQSRSVNSTWASNDPTGIYKLAPNGNLLWTAEDFLADHYADAYGWADTWELVVDSEGSVYVSNTAWIPQRQFDFGLVKYDSWGNHMWTRVTDMGSGWDAPRGLAIDSHDRIYQTGNAAGGQAGAVVFDTEGNILHRRILNDQTVSYPYGTAVDNDGNLIIHGTSQTMHYVSEITKYSPELTKLASVQYEFPNRIDGATPSRTAVDPWGDVYCLQSFKTTDYPYGQVGIIKVGKPPISNCLSWAGTPQYESDGVSPDSGTPGNPFVFCVKYTNLAGQAPGAVKLELALNGIALPGSPLTMINESGSTDWVDGVVFSLSVRLEEGGTYAYRFRAYDLSGAEVAVWPSASGSAQPGPMVLYQHSFSAGQRMIGIPVQVNGSPTMEDLLGIADDKVGWWDPQHWYVTFDAPTEYILGRGYWAQFADETEVEITGTDVTGEFTYNVQDGWNIISSPYNSEIALAPITNASTLWPLAWTDQGNGYELVGPITDGLNLIHNTIQPWWGYWVLSSGNGEITWNYVAPAAQKVGLTQIGKAGADHGGWQIQLTAHAGSRADRCNYCGVAEQHTAQVLAIPHPPPVYGSVDLYFASEAGLMATDIRPTSDGKLTWEFEVRTDLPDTEVTVGYPDLSVVPNDYRLLLTDLDAGKSVYMRTTHGYSYNAGPQGGIRRFRITAEPKSEASLLITGMTTQQVSGQQAAISYSLSAVAQVDIQIRNIAGRLIRRIQTDKLQPAGSHTTTWNLANTTGNRVPRATYLCVITARTEDGQAASCLGPITINR